MTKPSDTDARLAALLHLRAGKISKGEPVALPIIAASNGLLPGTPEAAFMYARFGNPTWQALEAQLTLLEGAPSIAFPSGMAALTAVFQSVLKAGDTVLVPSDSYYTVRVLLETFFAPMDITMRTAPTRDLAAADMSGVRLALIETPSNPGLEVCDIAAVCAAAHKAGALVVADNTSATPLLQQPLDLGADIIASSDTKAMAGHGDVLLGHVATRDAGLFERVMTWRKLSGSIPGPFEAWMVHRGIETLDVRMERMCNTAQVLAEALQAHASVQSVRYPGLPGDPSHAIASRQMQRFGSIIALTLKDEAAADHLIETCPLIVPATSFGSVHTTAERRARWGDDVPAGFVRLSVGCEPADALVEAVLRAL